MSNTKDSKDSKNSGESLFFGSMEEEVSKGNITDIFQKKLDPLKGLKAVLSENEWQQCITAVTDKSEEIISKRDESTEIYETLKNINTYIVESKGWCFDISPRKLVGMNRVLEDYFQGKDCKDVDKDIVHFSSAPITNIILQQKKVTDHTYISEICCRWDLFDKYSFLFYNGFKDLDRDNHVFHYIFYN
jgi:hypothetical protein